MNTLSEEARIWRRKKIHEINKRSRKAGIKNKLKQDHIPVPETCPIFGTPLIYKSIDGLFDPNYASIDRIDPNKWYEDGNIRVMSVRANTLLSDATIGELKAIVAFLEECSQLKQILKACV